MFKKLLQFSLSAFLIILAISFLISDVAVAGSAQPAGNGMIGSRGDGPGEVAFGSTSGPRFLHKVVPCYPPFARKLEKQGVVLLRATINGEGRAVDVEILKEGGFGFDEAAVKAIMESTFIPAKRDGRSFSCKALLPVRFELKSWDIGSPIDSYYCEHFPRSCCVFR